MTSPVPVRSTDRAAIEAAIAALEAQRPLLGDAVVVAATAPLRAQLDTAPAAAARGSADSRARAGQATSAVAAELPADALQQRRRVTILFLDVVGSTVLGGKLDPEEIADALDGLLANCTQQVQRHGGRVLQYAGDSLLAVFGADEAREDDALRAVRAGLALLTEGKHSGEAMRRQHRHDGFDVRVGLHTGPVLLGGGIDAEGSIRGQAVNIAARMEQSAPPGGLRISQDTYRLVQGAFDVQAQPPMAMKGLAAPMRSWLVERARAQGERARGSVADGPPAPLIGRLRELDALLAAARGCHADAGSRGGGASVCVVVVAEAGFGKTRLLQAFDGACDDLGLAFERFEAQADPQRGREPFGLARDLFAAHLGWSDADPTATARARFEQRLVPLLAPDDGEQAATAQAHVLGQLLGFDFSASPHVAGILDDPAQIRARAFHAGVKALRRVQATTRRLLLLRLENLHWADAGSLDFLHDLRQAAADLPMLLLCTTRSVLFERVPDWADARSGIVQVPLGALDGAERRALAEALLRPLPDPPAALLDLLCQRSEGVPFFMEGLLNMLIDQGVIEASGDDGVWTVDVARLGSTEVPPTLAGVLLARLDQLDPRERLTLRQASVLGVTFWDAALEALAPGTTAVLPALERRGLVHRRDSPGLVAHAAPAAAAGAQPAAPAVSGDEGSSARGSAGAGPHGGVREYVFGHALMRDVTYDTLLLGDRRRLHAGAAQWLEGTASGSTDAMAGVVAGHWERAGRPATAARHYARAAHDARRRYANEATLDWVAQALPLLDALDPAEAAPLRWQLLDARERTLELQGRRDEQAVDLDALQTLADDAGDDSRRADLGVRRSLFALRVGRPDEAAAHARRSMAQAAAADDVKLRLNAERLVAFALAHQGALDEAEAIAQRGLAECRERGLLGLESRFLNTLTSIAAGRDDLPTLLAHCERATSLRRALGDLRNEANGLTTLGGGHLELGDFAAAERHLSDALRLHRTVGNRVQEPVALANLAKLAWWRGDTQRALELARQALVTARTTRARDAEAFAHWVLGHAAMAQQRAEEAAETFRAMADVAAEAASPYRADALAGLATVARHRHDDDAAGLAVAELLAHPAAPTRWPGSLSARSIELVCWEVLDDAADPRAAALLNVAADALHAAAAALADGARRAAFFEQVPPNRALAAALRRHGSRTAAPRGAAGDDAV